MKTKFNIKNSCALFIAVLMIAFNINIFATSETNGTDSVLEDETSAQIVGDTVFESETPETTVQSEPKITVITEYGIEVTVKSTKGEYAANEIPQLSLSVRNTNSYSIRNLIAKGNLPSALAYAGANRAVVNILDMQAGHSQTVDFQIKRVSSSGGGGSVNTADSNSNVILYVLLGIGIVIFAGAIIFAVLMGKKKTKILTILLCFGLALQNLPVVADAQVDSGSFNVIHTIKYNSVNYGINISVSFGDAPVTPPSGSSGDSNAQGWEELQILDFYSDVSDVLVNESVNAKFSAVVLSSNRISNQSPKLYEGNRLIGELKDDGSNGDIEANDGIFTTSVNLSSNVAKNTEYFASFGTMRSDPVDICFYEEIEDNSFDIFQSILDHLNTKENYNDVINYLESSEYVTSQFYDEETESVTFTTTFGIVGVWSADDNGMKKEGALNSSNVEFLTQTIQNLANSQYNLTNKKIAVLRPYRSTDFQYDDFLTAAKATANAINGTVKDFTDGAVTLDVMSDLDEYGIVLIDSHGSLFRNNSNTYDQYINIGQDFKQFSDGFSADFYSGRITVSGDGRIAVNADFFKNRYNESSFDNTLFFLGSCYSMYDESISDVLLDCNAEVVFGYTDKVSVSYCNKTLACMQTNLVDNRKTVLQAHTATLDSCGTTDPAVSNCRFVYDGNRNYSYASQYGVIKGSVIAYETDFPINWIKIHMEGDNGQVYDFIQNGGMFEKKVEAGTYSVVISAYGCLSRTLANVVITNGQTTYIEESLLLEGRLPDEAGAIVINGRVINAINGEAVVGATVKFISSHGGTSGNSYVTDDSGNILELVTDEQGLFTVSDLVKGYYTAEISADGYITEYRNVIASSSTAQQEIAINPILSETGDFRIVLSWNESPRDLDAHIEGMWSSNDRFHVYYAYSNEMRNGENIANLDLDDRSGYGPETITLTVDPSAKYAYYVRNYSGETPLYSSGARVKVYQGNTLLETYNVPVEHIDGRVWNVFKIENGRIITVNQIVN